MTTMTVRPVDLRGPLPTGTTVLEASAGTGKTYTIAGLVTRYVAEGHVRLDQLLVVTFGRDAMHRSGRRRPTRDGRRRGWCSALAGLRRRRFGRERLIGTEFRHVFVSCATRATAGAVCPGGGLPEGPASGEASEAQQV